MKIIGVFLAALLSETASAHELDGMWENEAGSIATISVDATGKLTGRYCSQLGQVDPQDCHPLTGHATGDVVGFTVLFDPPGSVTAWSGQIGTDADGDYLRTLWHLSRDVAEADEEEKLWESVIAGYATFRRIVFADDRTVSPQP